MMKNADKQEIISSLNQKFKKKKYFSILLALFTLGVNIFAWFAFSANVNVTVNGTVAAWDVQFKDNSGVVSQYVTVDVTKMKPGMDDFVETLTVENNSDVDATFYYELISYKLLGHTFDLKTKANAVTYLRDYYPFSITLNPNQVDIIAGDTLTFNTTVVWPYESATTFYYAQDDVYNYDESFVYYKNNSGTYTTFDVPNASIYASQKSSLFLEKDDADTYFGMQCHAYEASSGNPCLSLTMKLIVQQKLD